MHRLTPPPKTTDAPLVSLVSPSSRAFNHYRPPLALMCLSGYLKKNGIPARVIDVCLRQQVRDKAFERNRKQLRQQVEDETLAQIQTQNADIIGITCYTPELDEVEKLAARIKTAIPHARLVVGGIHPTLYPEHFLHAGSPFDFAVVGEGELTFLELVKAIRSGQQDIYQIAGIAFFDRTTGRPCVTTPRPVAQNLDDIIFPDYDDLDMDYYTTASPYSIRGVFIRSFYVTASRGCPSSCTFCVAKKLRDYHGPRHFTRVRSAKALAAEVLELRDAYAIDGFYFIDDLFTLKKEIVMEFCDLLRHNGKRLIWGCSSKVNTVTFDMLRAMRDAGCVQIDFGVEKGSDAALKQIKKGITVNQIRTVFSACHQLGIRTFANMLVNTPGETEQDLADILTLLNDLHSEIVALNTFTPYPGCEIHDEIPVPLSREDYPWLMTDPRELVSRWPHKYRFASHQVDMKEWTDHWMHKTNRVTPNLAFHLRPRYLATLAASRRKMDYLRQTVALAKEFVNQKF